MDNNGEDDKEQGFWFIVVAIVIVGVLLGFVAESPAFKTLLILALVGGCCLIAHFFYRLGSRSGRKQYEEEMKVKQRAVSTDVWECMHIHKGVLGGEVLTLKRDPHASPSGPSEVRKKQYSRVTIVPLER